MTFLYTDLDGDRLEVRPGNGPTIKLDTLDAVTLHRVILAIPVDHVEELIAGIRDTARQAATETQPAQWHRTGGFDQHDDYRETTP